MLFCIQYSFQTISDEPSQVIHRRVVIFLFIECYYINSLLQVDFVLRCLKVESDYVSVFHPVSLLRKEVCKMNQLHIFSVIHNHDCIYSWRK